ncbi:MAG: MarR family transcriptional regulator [Oscillospiraceae bacterium]|nr:MarR family transcriptional regulator [Oscillospiraceae bacterium]
MKPQYGPRFRALHWCTEQIMSTALADMDLTSAQGHIMGFIVHQSTPPCSRDIEEAFHLSHPTVSGTLSRMERKGFIEFRPDENDRRCKRIYILPKGLECHERMTHTIESIEQQILRGFTPEEQALFSQFLNRAITNMGGSPCPPPFKEEL